MLLVPHVFVPAGPPHPIEGVNLAAIVLTSSAAPVMSVHSVTGEGTALCTALLGCVGLNLDCGDIPSESGDINANSVMTSPTLGDYVAAVIATVLNALYAWKTGGIIGGGSSSSRRRRSRRSSAGHRVGLRRPSRRPCSTPSTRSSRSST